MHKDLIKTWHSIKPEERLAIFKEAGEREGLSASAIEKDWWVTTALKIVFSLSCAKHLIFKGGTSLSKGWNLIERFSEDIDLAVDRTFLGFKGELSKTQVKKLRKASCTFISGDFASEIEATIKALGIPDVKLSVQDFDDSDKDPLVVQLNYKSLTNDAPYLQPRVLIEIGARSLMEPTEQRGIQSLVGKIFTDQKFTDELFPVSMVLPKRTFLEKAFLLHEEFQKPTAQIRVERLSRHLYDLDRLADTPHSIAALEDFELYQSVVTHRQRFNALRGIDYTDHHPNKIDFIPPLEVIGKWKSDYKAMQESMIYGESKSFDQLTSSMEKLRERFREIKT